MTRVIVGPAPEHARYYEYPEGSDLTGWQAGPILDPTIYVADEATAERLRAYLQAHGDSWARLTKPGDVYDRAWPRSRRARQRQTVTSRLAAIRAVRNGR